MQAKCRNPTSNRTTSQYNPQSLGIHHMGCLLCSLRLYKRQQSF